MSFLLNKRELAHKQLGHWHFDLDTKGRDVISMPGTLSRDLCAYLVDLGQAYQGERKIFSSRLYLAPHADAEVMQDKQDISERFVGKTQDLDKEWFHIIYIETDRDLQHRINSDLGISTMPSTNNRLHATNNDKLPGVRLAVQRPGCVTINHIDHVYGYDHDRPSRFDDPFERKVVVFLQDHVSGQYFTVGNHNLHPWQAGQAFSWDWGVPHHAANISATTRYNLMLSIDARQHAELEFKIWR